ncbi:MAG: sugar phosphate isomerase/epimerase family protein [Candidatus Odinarchaeota archaeon]
MQLGISTLGHISEMGLNGKYKNLFELHLKASEECLNFAEQSGINVIELIIESPVIANRENKQKFIDLVNSYSLEKQVHGPFIDMNLCSLNKYISKASIESYLEAIKLCDKINSNMITIHPGSADFIVPLIREFNKAQLKSAIHKLFATKINENLMICLENMPQNYHIMTNNKNIEEVLQIIDHKNLFLTYDTSHFYTCDGDVQHFWSTFHNIIKNIHIVDNYSKKTDTHPPLGTGKVDFKEIFKVISQYNYSGSLIVELSSVKSLKQSINFINKFL